MKRLIVMVCLLPQWVFAGAFLFSNSNANRVTHPTPYTGTGGEIEVTFCVNPASESLTELEVSAQNVATVFNNLEPVTGNVLLGNNNDIPAGTIDFESTLLHELGHCLGLAHPNLATESGLPSASRNYTQASPGANTVFNIAPGADSIIGSADDLRGDDVNRHWFRIVDNNPFLVEDIVDATTYSVDLADLPVGDIFATNADRAVSGLFGLPTTEAVMQQGAFGDEDQRQLGHDDVATIRLGMAGVDEIQGTDDDYTLRVNYIGAADNCDVQLNVTGTSFAFCSVNGSSINNDHFRIASANIQLGSPDSFNWFFNQTLLGPDLDEEFFIDGFESE